MPENPAPETSALSTKAGMGSTPKSSNLKIKNAMAKKIKGRPRSADPCRYHYNFKLNEAQNKRFLDMLERSGCTDNKSRFILSRLFGCELRVVKTDPATQDFCARLGDLHFQIRKVGLNYNQVVKAIHHNYDAASAARMLWRLEQETRKMTELQQQILTLAEEFEKRWSDE